MSDITEKNQPIQWHPAFVAGMEIALRNYKKNLRFIPELELTRAPLSMDLFIIKKEKGKYIDNDIGRAFRTYNIVEYKSPEDGLTIDDLYKTLAYADLYKASGKRVNEIPADNITVTLIQNRKPRDLFKELRRLGIKILQGTEGIYTIQGASLFCTQIVVTAQLKGPEFVSLRILSRKPEIEDIRTFIKQIRGFDRKDDRENSEAVLHVSMAANGQKYDLIKEESMMDDLILKTFLPDAYKQIKELDQAKREADLKLEQAGQRAETNTLNYIKSVIENFKVTAQQAMDVLKIPEEDRAKYLTRL